jgi:hypothetical protein
MPRAEELVGVAACPVCDYLRPEEPPPEPAGEVSELPFAEPEPAAPSGRAWFGTAIGLSVFLAGASAGVLGLLAWQGTLALKPDRPPEQPPAVAAAAAPAPTIPVSTAPPAPPAPAPPRTTPLTEIIRPEPPAPPKEQAVAPPAPQPAVVPPPPLPAPVPPGNAAPPNPFRPAAPLALRVDNPGGEVTMVVPPGRSRIVRGKVRVLKVFGLEAGASLDCSDLDADEVVVTGKIDGGSKLWVKAAGGRVTFLARIDGRSHVEVRAPGGLVNFAPPGTKVEGGRVEGGATVEVLAKAVTVYSRIHGPGTRVTALLTEGGSLMFAEIDGPARLEYRRSDPDDPDPVVTRGGVGPEARFVKLRDPDE